MHATTALFIGFILSLVSVHASSTIIVHGDLATNTSSNFITDTLTGRMYLRGDRLTGLSYSEIVHQTSSSQPYFGWKIANTKVADEFLSAAFGSSSTPCAFNGTADDHVACGSLGSSYSDGDFGNNWINNSDVFWFLESEGSLLDVGVIWMHETQGITQNEKYMTFADHDLFWTSNPINTAHGAWLLYRDVPEPGTFALMCTGIVLMSRLRKT